MHSTDGNLISAALQRSFAPNSKKKVKSFDDHIIASARRVLSTKIEYVHCPQYSASTFLDSLKSKYTVLKSNKSIRKLKKKKKKNKHRPCENTDNNQMKNTELSGQDHTLPEPKIELFSPDDVQLGWKGNIPVGSGFVNLGTTCYINSTLQALFHVPSFVNWLMDDRKHHVACEKMNGMLHTECLVCAMSKTLHASHRLSGGSVRPRHIIEKVKMICKHLSPFRQEDAHEFLRYLMEAMEKSYIAILGIQAKKLDSFSKETTPLSQIFGGYIRTEVTCLECSHISTTFQHFQDLILDIRQHSTSTVFDALENYFSKERLDGDEAYHCERCKKKVSAYKKFSIEKAPNALCIQLKRFNISSFYGGSKISKLITIPQTIDLSKFKHKKGTPNGTILKYRLVSMVFHHGPSSYSGHYTALGCTSGGSYYYFNDDQVYATHLGQYTNNPNAYIMFYEREKSSIPENSFSLKIASTLSLASTASNGYANGSAPPRLNGFFSKRENLFASSINHQTTKYVPSWELNNNNNENKSPMKGAVTPVNAASTSTSASSSTPSGAAKSSSSTSLVPYMSSDSDSSSDSEAATPKQQPLRNGHATDANNNARVNDESRHHSTPSSLAKKNSTLTSLLTSSPKNDAGIRATQPSSSTSSSLSSFSFATSNLSSSSSISTLSMPSLSKTPSSSPKGTSPSDDGNDAATPAKMTNGDGKRPSSPPTDTGEQPKATAKRGFISFKLFNSNRTKTDRNESKEAKSETSNGALPKSGSGGGGDGSSSTTSSTGKSGCNGDESAAKPKSAAKQTPVGVATMYFGGKDAAARKESSGGGCADEDARPTVNGNGGPQAKMCNGDASHAEKQRANGLVNGVDKSTAANGGGGGADGGGAKNAASNGWIVTDLNDADRSTSAASADGDKNASPQKWSRSEWTVTEKAGRRSFASPTKSNEVRENSKKCNGTTNGYKNDSSRNDFHNVLNSFSYSSQNGYGGKVMTWKGELSHINREVELERKETMKRSHEYDDEQDRGKIKKMKFCGNRNENHSSYSQSPRKNPVQQYHNRVNQNKRPWGFNQNSYNYNNGGNRRYNGPGNGGDVFRPNGGGGGHNKYGYRHATHVAHQRWKH